jgi:uncharacterized iron-regulated protein
MDEKEFLKRSEYFERWGFDYNLYKPILDFAKAETIPVIALNMDREIIRKVSKNGIDALEQDERDLIPARMDFTDREYRDRLHEVFEHHAKNEEKEFDNFYTRLPDCCHCRNRSSSVWLGYTEKDLQTERARLLHCSHRYRRGKRHC